MVQWTWQKIGGVVLALIIFGFVSYTFFGPGELFENVKDAVAGVKKYTPDINVGLDNLTVDESDIPQDMKKSAQALQQTLQAMVDSPKSECFQTFGGFRKELGTDGEHTATFLFSYQPDVNNLENDKTAVIIKKDKSVIYSKFDVKKMKPCIVAGSEEITKNFFLRWVEGNDNIKGIMYQQVDGINIYYNENGRNGNVIRVIKDKWPNNAVNDESKNYESDGMLFKGKNNEICFIPTNWNVDYDVDGIDNDYVGDMSNEDSLMYKLKKGGRQLTKCSDINGYEAIELFADNDASASEFDCELNNRKDTKSKVEGSIDYLHAYQGEDGDCTDAILEKVGVNVPSDGCWTFVSEDDDSDGNDCAWVEISPGEIIPSSDAEHGVKLHLLKAPRYENTDPLCVLYYHTWKNQNNQALLCEKNKWKVCDQGMENVKVTLNNVEYSCEQKNDVYTWMTTSHSSNDWFTYEGLELFEDNDEDYPDDCETDNSDVYFACDERGSMGKVTEKEIGNGAFPCPSQDIDCDDDFKKFNTVHDKGCRLFMSEDDDASTGGNNDCAFAIAPLGEMITDDARVLYHCDDDDQTCDQGPLAVNGDEEGQCLLQNKQSTKENEPGAFLCAKSKKQENMWHLCESRKIGDCLDIDNGEQWCCQQSEEGLTFVKK